MLQATSKSSEFLDVGNDNYTNRSYFPNGKRVRGLGLGMLRKEEAGARYGGALGLGPAYKRIPELGLGRGEEMAEFSFRTRPKWL